jgi:hypothetical protein
MNETMQAEPIMVRGFFRVHLEESGEIVGDSGWTPNVVVNEGKRNYLARLLGALAGSSQVTHAALGTGGAPATDATSLTGEVVKRQAVSAATNGSSAVQFTATFSSADSFVTSTQNISNIGLFATSSGGTIFAGNTYASSSCATNQNVNVTYQIQFS